jgi:hypothetical protein
MVEFSSRKNESRLRDNGRNELFYYVFSSRCAENRLKRVTGRFQTSKKGRDNE